MRGRLLYCLPACAALTPPRAVYSVGLYANVDSIQERLGEHRGKTAAALGSDLQFMAGALQWAGSSTAEPHPRAVTQPCAQTTRAWRSKRRSAS